MQGLEVSCAVRRIYTSLGAKGFNYRHGKYRELVLSVPFWCQDSKTVRMWSIFLFFPLFPLFHNQSLLLLIFIPVSDSSVYILTNFSFSCFLVSIFHSCPFHVLAIVCFIVLLFFFLSFTFFILSENFLKFLVLNFLSAPSSFQLILFNYTLFFFSTSIFIFPLLHPPGFTTLAQES